MFLLFAALLLAAPALRLTPAELDVLTGDVPVVLHISGSGPTGTTYTRR